MWPRRSPLFENGAFELNRAYIDLDDTLADHDGQPYDPDHIPPPFEGAVEFMEEVKALPHVDEVLIYSCRTSPWVQGPARVAKNLKVVKAWLEEWDIPYDRVYTGDGKPDGVAFVDDRGVPC